MDRGMAMRFRTLLVALTGAFATFVAAQAFGAQGSPVSNAGAGDVAAKPARKSPAKRGGDIEVPMALKSTVALVVDQDTEEVLLEKNSAHAILPIASITKLMTAL